MNNLLNLNNFSIPADSLQCTNFITSLNKKQLVQLCNEVSIYAHKTFKNITDDSDLDTLEEFNYTISKNIAIAMVYDSAILSLLGVNSFENNDFFTSNELVITDINNVNFVKVVKTNLTSEDLQKSKNSFEDDDRDSTFHIVIPELDSNSEIPHYKIAEVNFNSSHIVTKFIKNFNSVDTLKLDNAQLKNLDKYGRIIVKELISMINDVLYTAFTLKIFLSILKTTKKIDVLTNYEHYSKKNMSNIFIEAYFNLRNQACLENKNTKSTKSNTTQTKKEEVKVIEVQEKPVEVVIDLQNVEDEFQNEEDELKKFEAELEAKRQALKTKKEKAANTKKEKIENTKKEEIKTTNNTKNSNNSKNNSKKNKKKNTNKKNTNTTNNTKKNSTTTKTTAKNTKIIQQPKPACANDADLPD